ncbi:hypothetical protein ABOM_002642 [Aspergillus bombycis]|uniref:Uncharacterized protein n=1 Tax=Aspergillus bombycis TaxID=109264 RepID=A0A1F8A7U5_9EURO|nr:hypothetical protein ABOM_002642 [Aspergillus bombycis]OGM47435.1 hypothetical protein ABOM_002642 [Aspergillus bombycis]
MRPIACSLSCSSKLLSISLVGFLPLATALLTPLPLEFQNTTAQWAYLSYENPSFAVMAGEFNRSAFVAQTKSETSDPEVTKALEYLNSTDFVAYDERFFDLIGPEASIRRLHDLPFQTHEAPCYNPSTKELFFIEWGPPGGDDGSHDWQYLLNTETNELRKISTNPPIHNVHGCAFHNGSYYVVTDGSQNQTASLNRINPDTLEVTTLLNNYYGLPFQGFNDLDIDSDGNFWITDDHYGWGRGVVPFTPRVLSTVYFVNGTTLRPRPFHVTENQANGIAFSQGRDGKASVVISHTGAVSPDKSHREYPFRPRTLEAYDVSYPGAWTSGHRLVSVPISFVYDGIRTTKSGWVLAGAGEGVDVLDPQTGLALGTIRVGGGDYVAVNTALGEKELWIVGAGGVWHVAGFRETLTRGW